MQLLYTPLYHFSRKVRLLLNGLNLDVELIHIGNAASVDLAVFGENPLLAVPVLKDGESTIFDSDGICEYLVRRYNPADEYGVLRHDLRTLNARAVMNGVMAAEVELVLSARMGLEIQNQPRLDRKREVIKQGLEWLEANSDLFGDQVDYLSFHLISLWDHLELFKFMPSIRLPKISAQVEYLRQIPFVVESAPVTR